MNGGQRRMTSAARWLFFIRAAKNGRDGDKKGSAERGRPNTAATGTLEKRPYTAATRTRTGRNEGGH